MRTYIFNFLSLFQVIVFILISYYLVLSLFGLFKKDNKRNKYRPKKSFALIVAAHNEEKVIGKIIESLKNLNYPKSLYDIYIIADNCNDKTALIAKNLKVNVYTRFDNKNKGKGYALEWMFNILYKINRKYDAIGIFDADNLVSKDFLLEMNSKILEGNKVIQGYIDSKNPHDSWITESYSISFWCANRLFQLARSNLNLSNQIGGTGFVICTEVLKKIGWNSTCLTEDLDLTCKLVLNDYKVAWAHNAIVYDEKPLTLKQSWRQRKRWMQGFTDVSSRFLFKLFKKAIKENSLVALDCALYVLQPFVTLLLGISYFVTLIQNNYNNVEVIWDLKYILPAVIWKSFSILQFLLTPYILLIEKKMSEKIFSTLLTYSFTTILLNFIFDNSYSFTTKLLAHLIYMAVFITIAFFSLGKNQFTIFIWYLLYIIYTLTWIPITIQGIMNRKNKDWSHTEHIRQIGISEI